MTETQVGVHEAPSSALKVSETWCNLCTKMADMDELMNAEFKEAFDEFDKVISYFNICFQV